jgi:hypothetical protein
MGNNDYTLEDLISYSQRKKRMVYLCNDVTLLLIVCYKI